MINLCHTDLSFKLKTIDVQVCVRAVESVYGSEMMTKSTFNVGLTEQILTIRSQVRGSVRDPYDLPATKDW